jgi:hypothetical protein
LEYNSHNRKVDLLPFLDTKKASLETGGATAPRDQNFCERKPRQGSRLPGGLAFLPVLILSLTPQTTSIPQPQQKQITAADALAKPKQNSTFEMKTERGIDVRGLC